MKPLGHAGEMTSEPATYPGYRFPAEIISYAVWLYHVFGLSFREVELLLAERGITVSHESIRQWCLKFGADFARKVRQRRPKPGDTWHLDEVLILSAKSEVLEIPMAWAATVAAAKRDDPQELASTWHSRTGCRVRIGLQG
jgi:putative transposase